MKKIAIDDKTIIELTNEEYRGLEKSLIESPPNKYKEELLVSQFFDKIKILRNTIRYIQTAHYYTGGHTKQAAQDYQTHLKVVFVDELLATLGEEDL